MDTQFRRFVPNPRDPLTFRYARSLREAARNPYDSSEGSSESASLLEPAPPDHGHNLFVAVPMLFRLVADVFTTPIFGKKAKP